MADLKRRLARLRELGLVKAAEIPPQEEPRGLEATARSRLARAVKGRGGSAKAPSSFRRKKRAEPSCLEGWERAGDLLWSRRLLFPDPLPELLDPEPFAPLARRRTRDGGAGRLSGPLPTENLRFFDLETTGLSGGSGTVAFLAAIGRRATEGLEVRQLFLEDYPGEAAFVDAILRELDEAAILVTYNGRAFDLPLLRVRCVMNGIVPVEREHVDALFLARRLWARVAGGASLGLLEREVLGIERSQDVSGSLIPSIWLGFLRAGDHPLMRVAMSHNADDVSSLARLVSLASQILAEPRARAASSSVDRGGLGRVLMALGRGAEAEELLAAAAADGDEASGLLLSRILRREGRVEERREMLELLPRSFLSCVERAKFLEHSARDCEAALAWTDAASGLAVDGRQAASVGSRRERLLRKLGSRRNSAT